MNWLRVIQKIGLDEADMELFRCLISSRESASEKHRVFTYMESPITWKSNPEVGLAQGRLHIRHLAGY